MVPQAEGLLQACIQIRRSSSSRSVRSRPGIGKLTGERTASHMTPLFFLLLGVARAGMVYVIDNQPNPGCEANTNPRSAWYGLKKCVQPSATDCLLDGNSPPVGVFRSQAYDTNRFDQCRHVYQSRHGLPLHPGQLSTHVYTNRRCTSPWISCLFPRSAHPLSCVGHSPKHG